MDLNDVRVRLVACRDAMLDAYLERDDAVEACVIGALAQEHVLLLGPPGTGKSHLLNGLTACIVGARQFNTLVTRFTTEDEVCGPMKLSVLKAHDRVERNTDGVLPGVEVAFLDETFKANSAVLNSILSVMNERTYKGAKVPLRFLVGASNEMPEDDSLAAMFDRFLIRHRVEYIKAPAARRRYQRAKADGTLNGFKPPATITLDEWDAACRDTRNVTVPDVVVDEVVKLQETLVEKGIIISDRRIGACYALLKAAAWLDGSAVVEMDHLSVLRFALWLKPEDIPVVKALIDQLDMGPAREALAIVDEALRAYENRPTSGAAYYNAIPDLAATIKNAANRVKSFEGRVGKRAATKIARAMVTLKEAHTQLKADLARRMDL